MVSSKRTDPSIHNILKNLGQGLPGCHMSPNCLGSGLIKERERGLPHPSALHFLPSPALETEPSPLSPPIRSICSALPTGNRPPHRKLTSASPSMFVGDRAGDMQAEAKAIQAEIKLGRPAGNCCIHEATAGKFPSSGLHLDLHACQFAPGSSSEMLITSADSRIRVVDGAMLVQKFKATLVRINVLAPALGLPSNPEGAKEAEEVLNASLSVIESYWLKDDAKFLLGYSQPSIADLSLACEITQLELLRKLWHERKEHNQFGKWLHPAQSQERRISSGSSNTTSSERVSWWQGQKFCNFLMACLAQGAAGGLKKSEKIVRKKESGGLCQSRDAFGGEETTFTANGEAVQPERSGTVIYGTRGGNHQSSSKLMQAAQNHRLQL